MTQLLKCELNKIIRLKSLIIAFLMPIIMVTIGLVNIYRGMFPVTDYLDSIYNQSAILYGGIALPIAITIIIAMQWRVEYKHQSIVLLYNSPVEPMKIYLSKVFATIIIVAINVIIFIGMLIIFSILLLPKGEVPSFLIYSPLVGLIFIIPFILIQHILSMMIKNFIAPIAMGVVFTFGGFLLNATKFGILIPNTYAFHGLFFNVPGNENVYINMLFIIVPILAITVQFLGNTLFKSREW